MLFNFRYSGSSTITSNARSVGMNFVPDTRRSPTHFVGQLNQKVPFREAISALHDVVISDLRFQPKDKSEYKRWAASQEDLWLAKMMAEEPDLEKRTEQIRQEIAALDKQRRETMGPFWLAQNLYFKWLFIKDKAAWWVLDPVITVHPDELFFECFSEDESSYGRLACSYEVFDQLGDRACGTTNIDYSQALYNEFQKIRDYKSTELKVDPSGFEIETEDDERFQEVKIDLPDSWVRGFLQVSSAMTLPGYSLDLHPMDVHNICFLLRRAKEKQGPRSLRFRLAPGEPVRIVFDPWNRELICPRSNYEGPLETEIRIWGRRRLLILERLIPMARRFRVTLLGTGMPSFWQADLRDMHFTLGLSGWTANDWSRMGNFDLMAPRANVDDATKLQVFEALQETWFENPSRLADRLGLDREIVLGALANWTQAGRAIYDGHRDVYRVRELSREPLPLAELRFSNPREAAATELTRDERIIVQAGSSEGITRLTGAVGRYHPVIHIDEDQRLTFGECTCNFHQQNKLRMGPCEHMLALRMTHQRNLQTTAVS